MDITKKLIVRYAEEPISARELTAKLGLNESTVRHHIRGLRSAKLMYISDWERGRTQITPLYKIGNKRDVPKPAPRSKAELNRRHRERNPHLTFYCKATPWDALMRKV